MFILLASIFSLARPRLFLKPDQGGASTPSAEETAHADFLDHLPGGEMLAGATGGKPAADPDELPAVWTPQNATGEEEGETGSEGEVAKGETKPAEVVPPPALEDVLKELPEAARTHFDGLTKERDTLKTEKETLAKEVEQLKAATPAPQLASTAEHPLANTNEEGLAWHAELSREVKSWARRNLAAGGEMPADLYARAHGIKPEDAATADRNFNADQAAGMLDRAEIMQEKVIPARREYLAIEKQTGEFVKEHYGDMLKPETEQGKIYSAFLQQFPQVKLLPRWQSALAALVIGHQTMDAQAKERAAKAAGQGKEPPMAPPIPGRTAGAAPANGAAKPASPKPKKPVALSASMSAEDLAGIL